MKNNRVLKTECNKFGDEAKSDVINDRWEWSECQDREYDKFVEVSNVAMNLLIDLEG